ncbi:MAG TPA: cation diffusion facilitator family transporter [Stellaceae bacterium]|nr:cation diffusion facilitator family transporter [Stellaceae bacterium]
MAHDHHAHAHGHEHHHHHAAGDFGRAFAIGIALNLIYVAAEAGYGLAAGSLALLADAGHNLGDVLGLGLSWGATVLGRRRPSGRFTYGLGSSSILAALGNALILLVVTGGIAWEAIRRLGHPVTVTGGTVAVVAAVGIAVNGLTALLFAKGRGSDLNLRSAFLHMAADALIALGVVIAGIAIALTGWLWLDPAVGLIVSVTVVFGTWDLVKQALNLALDAVPKGVDAAAVRARLLAVPGVTAIHDLHIWGMSTTETALTCHLVMPQGHPGDAALAQIAHELDERFHIRHTTLQIELGDGDEACLLTPEHVV